MDTEGISNAELVRRIGAGSTDSEAEAELCRRFAGRIRLYGWRHLREKALVDELIQQVLVIVLQSLRDRRVRDPERLASFILGSCRMIVRDIRRGEAHCARLLERYGLGTEVAPEPTAQADLERLRGCVENLSPRERTVLILTFYDERSGEEIAADLSMTPANVRVVRHRAVLRLQQCMGAQEAREW